jgi:ubiquinone/menaquinone biosynthesis C-methylase UbiE
MDARLQLRVQRYGWDRAAPHYERAWNHALAPATAAVLAAAALQPGERVLDVACGSGVLTRAAWTSVAPGGGAVVGTDLAEQMLAEAAGQSPNGQFVRVDGQCLEEALAHEHFDVVLCGLGLMYMPDPDRALASMARRLRPGGRLVVSVWGERRACAWADLFPIVDAQVQSEVCPMFFRLGGGDALAQALRGAGLSEVTASRLTTTADYADARSACEAAFVAGPVALAYSRFDAATRSVVHNAYLASIEPWRAEAGYSLPGEFVIGSARLPAA